ncbi:MAG: 2-oxoacid:ferredoxin oxidoreductase subunit beta [candidate division WOR-3 bacterium]
MNTRDYNSTDPVAWCPGCGNFGIREAVKTALIELGIEPWQTCFVSGIGQAPKLPHYIKCNLFNGLHGRTLPVATGVKLANPKLIVFAEGGDGDGYAEGCNHFLHALRRNVDLTYLVHNNQVYGLTKGQASPTSEQGFITKTTPFGALQPGFNPVVLAVAMDAGLVARSFSGNVRHLTDTIKQAVKHPGFSLVDILQPCVSFNRVNTTQWYRERVKELGSDYDPTDRMLAFRTACEWGETIPIGVIYRSSRPAYTGSVLQAGETRLIDRVTEPSAVEELLRQFH